MFMEEGRPTLTVGGGTIPWDGDQNHMKGGGEANSTPAFVSLCLTVDAT